MIPSVGGTKSRKSVDITLRITMLHGDLLLPKDGSRDRSLIRQALTTLELGDRVVDTCENKDAS